MVCEPFEELEDQHEQHGTTADATASYAQTDGFGPPLGCGGLTRACVKLVSSAAALANDIHVLSRAR